MEIACPLWPGATGVETELALPLSITARGALQKLLSYTHMRGFGGLGPGISIIRHSTTAAVGFHYAV